MTHTSHNVLYHDSRNVALHSAVAAQATLSKQFAALIQWLRQAYAVSHQRQQLAALNGDALRDIGVARDAALREADRPFWDHRP